MGDRFWTSVSHRTKRLGVVPQGKSDPTQGVSRSVFERLGRDYSAFVGWTEDTAHAEDADARRALQACLAAFFTAWCSGQRLDRCLEAYRAKYSEYSNRRALENFIGYRAGEFLDHSSLLAYAIAGCRDLTIYDR